MAENVVITWLLTSQPDPQRGDHLPADVAVIGDLRRSVHAHGRRLVVLHDCLDEPDDELTTFVRVEPGGNPYWYRWQCVADYLFRCSDLEFVWCVDGTDVEMLNDPFPHMEPDKLYVGSENKRYGDGSDTHHWLRHHCPRFTTWFDAHPDEQVLNVGTVGGGRDQVLGLADMLAAGANIGDDYEMGLFNFAVRQLWPDRFETGSKVHTPFLTNTRTGPSWWAHK